MEEAQKLLEEARLNYKLLKVRAQNKTPSKHGSLVLGFATAVLSFMVLLFIT
jgi:hypothetical protein